jgi:periplasmic copper chaperone A
MHRPLIFLSAAALLLATPLPTAMADCDHEPGRGCVELRTVVVDDIELAEPWARAMQPAQRTGGGYVGITNRGEDTDRLVHASSPSASRMEIHSMEVVDDVMTMRPVEGGLELPAGETVMLEPGGYHLMFIGVPDPFQEGETIEVTLEFEQAGRVELRFPVHGMGHGRGGGHGHRHDDHDGHEHSGHDH